MQILLTIGVLSIAAILFYRFLEGPHKALLGKLAIRLAVVVAILLVIVAVYRNYQTDQYNTALRQAAALEEAGKRTVSVTFLKDSSWTIPNTSLGCTLGLTKDCAVGKATIHALTFRLCNVGSDTVTAARFEPLTLLRGRSTTYNIVRAKESEPFSLRAPDTAWLTSDYILPPLRCAVLSWSGDYSIKDSVFARVLNVAGTGSLPRSIK